MPNESATPRKRLSCTEWIVALGCGGLLLLACGGFLVGGISEVFFTAREAARMDVDRGNLKQIALAVLEYEATYKQFPPAYTLDASGNKLHSWRTLILPYLEQSELYNSIDLSKPWDAPENANARAREVGLYKSIVVNLPQGQTIVRAIVHPNGVFRGAETTRTADIKDGLTKTLLFVQAGKDQSVHWMQPDDYSVAEFLKINRSNMPYRSDQTHIAFADGSIYFNEIPPDPKEVEEMVTINKNESIPAK